MEDLITTTKLEDICYLSFSNIDDDVWWVLYSYNFFQSFDPLRICPTNPFILF